ncbi:MAG: hypothetical protein Q7S22_03380 [Candidatus Micrarchaeota archaeon]|nr:hypothetical protein [Candidatus Micrarchaeota archaeon]
MDDVAYQQINKSWKNTCRVLLGDDVGNLMEFRDYLKRYTEPIITRKSHLSNKDITISSERVPKDANVIAYDEMEEYAKRMSKLPFDINKIKDIDSILEIVSERAYYAGNVVLGNSSNVILSHRCINTHYALECQDVYEGKYVAFTTSIRNPENSFGCCLGGDIQFCIKILDPYKTTRCMELFHCNVATDCYYSASLEDCTNSMFSFNQRSKNYIIGNVSLNKEKYAELKKKLVAEIAEYMKKNKSAPSIIDIIRGDSDG